MNQDGHGLIDHVFMKLMPAHGMAERPEQIALSHRMLDTLQNGGIALCDAGTGIGKTYAYLVAGIAFHHERTARGLTFQPILISTSSIALQNAVLKEYIPLLSELLMEDGRITEPIQTVIRKGKHHYACDDRLERRLRQVNLQKKNKAAADALLSLMEHLDADEAEQLSDYDRERVTVPQVCDCRRSSCRYLAFLDSCVVRRYHFQICNHNLLLADAIHREAGQRPILPRGCAVVIDEAHKLPEAARQMFGTTLAADDVRRLIRCLRAEKYLIAANSLSNVSKPLLKILERPREGEPFTEYVRQLIAPDRALTVIKRQLYGELTPLARRQLKDVCAAIGQLRKEDDNMIRYAAENEDGGVMLCATVTDLPTRLKETMWSQPQPFLLTSGTLAVGSDFHRFRKEAGLDAEGRAKESVSLSPFDYERNCLLYLPRNPLSIGDRGYYDKLAADIAALVRSSFGHALVLFTSYAAMSAIKERLAQKHLRWPLFTMNRHTVYTVEQFKRHPGAILLATGAVWEGFDFPGDAVSMLIIPRLPFPQPDAIKEKERAEYDTLHDFIRAVVVPEMQIKLKQGFGRAIRTESDTCAVAILDERACEGGRYHADVLSALPKMQRTGSMEDIHRFICSTKPEQYFKEGIRI